MEETTDIELISLARRGDKGAFGLLVLRYQMMAQRFARRLVSNVDCAQELTQEAILQAYLSLEHLHNPAQFKGWLCGIVANICRSYLRGQKIAFFSLEAMAGGLQFDSAPFSAMAANPSEIAEERELYQALLDVVNALEAGDRDVILRFYYSQLSLQEVAALQNVSVGAVKVRLHRARQRMKTRLMSQYPEIISQENRRKNMVKVTIYDVAKQERKDDQDRLHILYVIMLQDEDGRRVLPMWVGPFEGQSIATILSEIPSPRPMTYNFFANLLQAIKAQIEQVRIETLKENVFYATVRIRCGQTVSEIDARPSDALTLSALTGTSIFVAEDVLAHAGIGIPPGVKVPPARPGVESILKEIREMREWGTKNTPRPMMSQAEMMKAKEELISTVIGTRKDQVD